MSGLDRMRKRLNYTGYDYWDNKLVDRKKYSFHEALKRSYQAEWITFKDKTFRCLINPDKLKEDYDQKIISIDFESGMKNGETFLWDRTGSHWLVLLQDLSEEAYFRAAIRRCDYEIDVNGHRYWIYLRGPVETAIVWKQKHQIEINDLNYSMMFYVEKNEETVSFFKRFQKIKIDGDTWRVAAVDKYSQDGIIEVYLEEYFNNEMEDAAVEPVIVEPDRRNPYIDGPQIARPFDTDVAFTIVGATGGEFTVNSTKVEITEQTETSCKLKMLTGRAGSFVLSYVRPEQEDITLEVLIKSL